MHPRPVTWIDTVYPNGELMPRAQQLQKMVR